MKFAMFFLLCCLAFAAAAPQLAWPGLVAPVATPLGLRTVVAGPTVVNGLTGLSGLSPLTGARWIPGVGLVGPTFL